MVTVGDYKEPHTEEEDLYASLVLTAQDYYPFGMQMPGRKYSYEGNAYRYGFNGKELDKEGMGGGKSTYDYGFRIYNPGIAKFLSVDPLTKSYPWYTPYQFAGNKPIWAIDLDGLEEYYSTKGERIGAGDPDDKRKLLVLDKSTEKIIIQQMKENGAVAHTFKSNSVVNIPSPKVIEAMDQAYSGTEAPTDNRKPHHHEMAFAMGLNANGEYIIEFSAPGPEAYLPKTAEANQTEAMNKLKSQRVDPQLLAHTHPYQYNKEIQQVSSPNPSPSDIRAIEASTFPNAERIILGWNVIQIPPESGIGYPTISQGEKVVTYYNAKGKIGDSISFNKLKDISNIAYGNSQSQPIKKGKK